MKRERLEVCITGGAGFIGSHLVDCLLGRGDIVAVFDSFSDFYDPYRKRENISEHQGNKDFTLIEGDLRNAQDLANLFAARRFDAVVHLAALAGVRPSLERPAEYMEVNVVGTQLLIDAMLKVRPLPRLLFGSSSSVYGERTDGDFSETDRSDRPLSPYGASKAAGEQLCHAAHHTTGLNVLCLRFFTVFGPRQRPDLAIHKFCHLIDSGSPIEVYGDGRSRRDYTYVADIVSGIVKAIDSNLSGYEIINLGRGQPVYLADMIECIENSLGKQANKIHKPPQTGDVPYTCANIDKARGLLGYFPATSLSEGIDNFVRWYLERESRACKTPTQHL